MKNIFKESIFKQKLIRFFTEKNLNCEILNHESLEFTTDTPPPLFAKFGGKQGGSICKKLFY